MSARDGARAVSVTMGLASAAIAAAFFRGAMRSSIRSAMMASATWWSRASPMTLSIRRSEAYDYLMISSADIVVFDGMPLLLDASCSSPRPARYITFANEYSRGAAGH